MLHSGSPLNYDKLCDFVDNNVGGSKGKAKYFVVKVKRSKLKDKQKETSALVQESFQFSPRTAFAPYLK